MLKNKTKNRAFTLIEILLVIAIIGILAGIVLINVNDMKRKARNMKRLSDIRAYAFAFDMALDKNGEYPDPGDLVFRCLGDYGVKGSTDPNDKCYGNFYYESAILNSILAEFIGLPASENPIMCNGVNYNGYIYACATRTNNVCKAIRVYWFMEGVNQSCGIGKLVSPDFYGSTYCGYLTSF